MMIVVLAAGGSLGSAVARRAALAGHRVRAVVRNPQARLGLPPTIEVRAGDILDAASTARACEGADVIVHAANVPYPEWPRLVPTMAENALKAAEATGAVLAFPGNVYVYGRPRSRPVTEDHPMEPHTAKGRIRLDMERKYLEAHGDGRVRIVLPRYPDFYGPNVVNDLLRPIFEGANQGTGCIWPIDADLPHEFILIDDAAAAMLALIETPAAHGRAVHVPGPGAITPREFVRLAYEAGGHDPKVRIVSRTATRMYGRFNPGIRSAVEMLYLFDEPVILDGSLYRSLIGSPHPATPYPEGVARTVEWFRTHRTAG
jgi:nucleoside-diphosphate-sugar epimerase